MSCMTDEERARFREKAKLRAEAEAQNKGIAPQAPVQMNVQLTKPIQPGRSANGKPYAIASMVLGIVAVVFILFFWVISPICAVIGLVMSHMAKTRGYTGGMRTAGLVLSWVAIGLSILVTACFVWIYQFMVSMDWTHGNFADPNSFFR